MRTVAAISAALVLLLASVPLMLASISSVVLEGGMGTTTAGAPSTVAGLPPGFEQLYRSATGGCPGLEWQVLAAIGKIESDHGRSQLPGVKSGTNHAGAAGPMQFLISTWGGSARIKISSRFNGYASDGDGDGVGDVYKPADAILAAAKYLCAHRAPRDLRQAIYAYNHSWDYVDSVLSLARTYRAATSPPPSSAARPGLPAQRPSGADHITARMRTVRDLIREQFRSPYGVGCYRANDHIPGGGRGEHHLGRACDFMLSKGGTHPSAGEQARGDAIATWAQANAHRLGIDYIIWKQRIWSPDRAKEGWRPMSDRGGITANHFDHVHLTVA